MKRHPAPDRHPDALARDVEAIALAVETALRGGARLCGVCGCLCRADEACPVCRADLIGKHL